MSESSPVALYLFENSHLSLWAEDVAREKGIAVKVVPAPPQDTATCGLALEISVDACGAIELAFQDEGIDYRKLERRS
jgi:hypothetical protein